MAPPIKIPNSDEAIWLSYAKNVQQQLAPNGIGANQVLYICPPTYVGLGVTNRTEDINRDVGNTAGVALPLDSGALFTPGDAVQKYFDRMQTISNYIDPNSNGQTVATATLDKIKEARTSVADADIAYKDARQEAWTKYNAYLKKEKIKRTKNPESWESWSATNASDLAAYETGQENARNDYQQLLTSTYGPSVNNMLSLQRKIADGANEKESRPSYNMATVFDIPADQKIGKEDIVYAPAISLTGYRDRLLAWKTDTATNYNTWTLSVSKGSDVQWSDFNQSNESSKSGNKVWIIFNNESEKEDSTTKSAKNLENALDKIEFNLKIKFLSVFPVVRGSWDSPGLRSNFKFVKNTPAEQDVVIPTAMLVGYGVGLDAKFSDSAKSEVHDSLRHFDKTKEAGLNILGFQVKEQKNVDHKNESSKDDVKFNADNGTISISPESNLVPVLLGVLGKKTKI